MGDRSVAGTATFSVNEHRHDGPQVSPTLNNDLGGKAWPAGSPSSPADGCSKTPQRFASAIATALGGHLAKRGEPDVPNLELAVIQFYALTVYPHIVRSMFGISLDPQATEELLTSGVDTFLSYYRPAAPAQAARPGQPRTGQESAKAP